MGMDKRLGIIPEYCSGRTQEKELGVQTLLTHAIYSD